MRWTALLLLSVVLAISVDAGTQVKVPRAQKPASGEVWIVEQHAEGQDLVVTVGVLLRNSCERLVSVEGRVSDGKAVITVKKSVAGEGVMCAQVISQEERTVTVKGGAGKEVELRVEYFAEAHPVKPGPSGPVQVDRNAVKVVEKVVDSNGTDLNVRIVHSSCEHIVRVEGENRNGKAVVHVEVEREEGCEGEPVYDYLKVRVPGEVEDENVEIVTEEKGEEEVSSQGSLTVVVKPRVIKKEGHKVVVDVNSMVQRLRVTAQGIYAELQGIMEALEDVNEVEIAVGTKIKVKVGKGGIKIESEGEEAQVEEDLNVEVDVNGISVEGKKIVPPSKVKAKVKGEIKEMRLEKRGNKLVYQVKVKKRGTFLFVFPVSYEAEVEVNAETGEVEKENKPWWAFLVIP